MPCSPGCASNCSCQILHDFITACRLWLLMSVNLWNSVMVACGGKGSLTIAVGAFSRIAMCLWCGPFMHESLQLQGRDAA